MHALDALFYPQVPASSAVVPPHNPVSSPKASTVSSGYQGDEDASIMSTATSLFAARPKERRKYSALYDAYANDRYQLNPPEPLSAAYKQHVFPIHETSPTYHNYSVATEFLAHLRTLDAIPKLIHISWVSQDLLKSRNELVLNGVLQEVNLNSDWTARIWTDDEVEVYLQDKLSAKAYDLMKSTKIIEKLDLWRLLVVYYEGADP